MLLSIGSQLYAQPSDAYLTNRLNAGRMPGASMVVVKDGKWIFEKSLGKADISNNKDVTRHTIFMLASVSKTIVATAVMQQWEKGAIDLDIDVNNYLPFVLKHPVHQTDSITMRMLLTHTSAIEDNWNTMGSLYVYGDSPIALDSFMKEYFTPLGVFYDATGNFYSYQPGTQWNYSNMATTLAAYVVERVTGDLFSHYCDTAIFQKICMKNTSWLLSGIQDTTMIARPYSYLGGNYEDVGLYGYPDYPDGQLRTSVTSLTRFMTMYMQYGQFEGVRLLDSTTVDYMLQPQTTVVPYQGIIFYSAPSSNGDLMWGHNGGDAGVATAMYFNIAKKTGAIVLTNGDGTQSVSPDVLADTLYKYGLTVTPAPTDTFPNCSEPTAVYDVQPSLAKVSLGPNPTTGLVSVTTDKACKITLTDMHGRQVMRQSLKVGKNMLDLRQSAAPGIYVALITSDSGAVIATEKVMYLR